MFCQELAMYQQQKRRQTKKSEYKYHHTADRSQASFSQKGSCVNLQVAETVVEELSRYQAFINSDELMLLQERMMEMGLGGRVLISPRDYLMTAIFTNRLLPDILNDYHTKKAKQAFDCCFYQVSQHLEHTNQGWQGPTAPSTISISKMTQKMPKVSALLLPRSQSPMIFYSDGQLVIKMKWKPRLQSEIIIMKQKDRFEFKAIGDALGHDGDPLFFVCHDNQRNIDNLSGAGREAYIARLSEML
jgi:hypothetical protein